MKRIVFLLALIAGPFFVLAQPGAQPQDTSWKKILRESNPRINDLVHTKLDVRFDYDKSYLYGKAWITLKPHFYNTDSLLLDAKGMDIKEVSVMKGAAKSTLKYDYDGMQLRITLDKIYKGGENYTIYIDYTSKPNELTVKVVQLLPMLKDCILLIQKEKIKISQRRYGLKVKQRPAACGCPPLINPIKKQPKKFT
ncbi:MAG: hypothetical protein IPI88_20110 [Chitinophagaceae bacterium]|nr:hypothetical protein [Chitinophagaceae bacterium]